MLYKHSLYAFPRYAEVHGDFSTLRLFGIEWNVFDALSYDPSICEDNYHLY